MADGLQGWGWYYLSTILDDYSRYIIHWELCPTMHAKDVTRTIDKALEKAGICNEQRPKLLSDNGPCHISNELKEYIDDKDMKHIGGRPLHPQTQGKIERYHRSMKNIVKLEHYYLPSELKARIAEFVDYYNNRRYHESLQNVTPTDVYFGRDGQILKQRKMIKEKTMKSRRKNHQLTMSKL